MGLYWWLHGKLTGRSRAQRWAVGFRVHVDDTGARWEVDPPDPEVAKSGEARWSDLASVAEWSDNGAVPDGVMILRRGATEADFLPMEANGVRAFLEAARERGLVRPLDELVAEREANARRGQSS